jgi:hypothetical protein
MLGKRPPESLANFRWVGPMPDELKNLTWIARAHIIGRVVRLQARNQASHFAVKGHVILLPQDTTLRLDILPMTPASLPDVVRVVWTGKSAPDRDRIRSQFTVRRETVYNTDHGRRAYLKQFALTLACARTDYKAQGQTMLHDAVLDIRRPAQGPSASASPYVQFSRVPSLDTVFILRPFDSMELRRPLSDELLADSELAWEDEMAEKIKRLYGM